MRRSLAVPVLIATRHIALGNLNLLPTGSEEREVLEVGSIHVAILIAL